MLSLFFHLYNSWMCLQGVNLLKDSVAWEKSLVSCHMCRDGTGVYMLFQDGTQFREF